MLAWFALALAGAGAVPPTAVTVEQAPVRVQRRTFDPAHPPREMPPLTPPEAGLCWYEFVCETEIGTEMRDDPARPVVARVRGVKLKLQLNVVIWLRAGATAKLTAHEEGHRAIAEHFYRAAGEVAHRLGAGLMGRTFPLPVKDRKAASGRAMGTLQDELIRQFLAETADRCKVAEEKFDAITRHGLDAIPEAEAIQRSLR